MSTPDNSRRRLVVILASLVVVCFGSAYWLVFVHYASSTVKDDEAHKMGFESAERFTRVTSVGKGRGPKHDLTEDEFRLVQDVFQHDKFVPKMTVLFSLVPIQSEAQRRRAVQLARPFFSDKNATPLTDRLLKEYCDDKGRPFIKELANDPDPNIANSAKRALAASATIQKGLEK